MKWMRQEVSLGGFKVGDYCVTPSGRLAQVRGFSGDRVKVVYVKQGHRDSAIGCALLPHLLRRA